MDTRVNRKNEIIEALRLKRIPDEGGYFSETYRAQDRLEKGVSSRSLMTCIYYLMSVDSGGMNYLHKNESDIVHFYHAGWPAQYHIFTSDGQCEKVTLGPDIRRGDVFQLMVKGGHYKAARIMTERTDCALFPGEPPFTLLSEAVAPGFEFEDRVVLSPQEIRSTFPAALSQKMLPFIAPKIQ